MDLVGQDHQEKSYLFLMCDTHTKTLKETPPQPYHEIHKKRLRKYPKRKNQRVNKNT
jgi:hypothetical protein